MDHQSSLTGLQQSLGYVFRDDTLLREALTHTSYAYEHGLTGLASNERLEFLGDAVLELVVSQALFTRYPECTEGTLTKMRAAVVNTEELADCARSVGLGGHILLSRGEADSDGGNKKSILANTYEAVIAAIYLDSDLETVAAIVARHFEERFRRVQLQGFYRDFKSRLQEYAQKRFAVLPAYEILTETGPDHGKTFMARVVIDGTPYDRGVGSTKKAAQQDAARRTLKRLKGERP